MATYPYAYTPSIFPGAYTTAQPKPGAIPAYPFYLQAIQQLPGASQMSDTIKNALMLVGQIQHLPRDEAYIRQLGVDLIFKNGAEALNLILQKQPRVEFGDMGDSKAHAQWIKEQNLIMINQKYKNNSSREALYAISEAIYHEAGHVARLGDNQASIQEETNCLALNTLANRFHAYNDPAYANSSSDSRLIADGVALYPKLFFDSDPNKQGLVNRIIEKYGMLPPETPDHPIPRTPYGLSLVDRILRQIQQNNTMQWVA